ncbi:RNA-directed DNA polymerase, eukaryota [Tanacetum coccineum]
MAFALVINGSPTEEFQFSKGLKQGDPLSPFLFILIMESLHLSFQRVVDAGMFKGFKLGTSVNISHMFYADDAVFVGQWCESNISTLVHVLECFYRASGLRINMSKSKIMGVYVDSDKVKRAAMKLGYLILKPPFLYLGLIVGGSMSRVHAWNEVVERVKKRLSKWKMKTLSIGGRLTLLKSVLGSMPIFHMSIFKVPSGVLRTLETIRSHFFNGHDSNSKKASWVNWKKVLAPRKRSLLGVSILMLELEGDYMVMTIKYVPIEVNVHAWKVKSDSLPTRFNISRRGIYIDSIMCAICDKGAETSSHLFFSCCMVRQVVRLITCWWDVPYMEFESYDGWLAWLVNLRLPYKNKMMLEGVFYVMWWHLWTFRNKTIFEAKAPAKALFFDDVVFGFRYIGNNFDSTSETRQGKLTNTIDCVVNSFSRSQLELFFVYKDPFIESQNMSTSNAHQQSLADAGSKTRPLMLKRGSYIPWANTNQDPRPETEYDLTGDALKQYEADIEETRFNNEFDQFIAELGESLVLVYNRFSQLMNDLKRNKIKLPTDTINTKFLNCLQPEWIKAKKLEKTHDPLALVAHTSSSSRSPPAYYVTYPPSVVDYDDEYQGETFQNDPEDSLTTAIMLLACAITQQKLELMEELQDARNVQEESAESSNVQNETGNDSMYFMEQMLLAKKDEAGVILSNEQNDFLLADAAQMEELKELSANICMMARIQPANIDSNEGHNYDSALVCVEHDKYAHDSYKLEQLARNAYKEAEKQQIIANKVKQQNVELTKQLEQYKERVRVFKTNKATKSNFQTESIEADRKAKHADEDKYLDNVLNLEEKLKKNENVVIKMSQFVQALFMLGPKPLSFYNSKLKHGLVYENPYTLKKAISHNQKLYDASCLHSSKVHVNVYDTEKILEDATKSQIKMENKLNDPIAIEKKQNFHLIDYKKLNGLYETFVPQVELSAEQKYFSYVSTTFETSSSASTSSSPPATMPNSTKLMKHFHKMGTDFEKLFTLLEINSTLKSIFYTSREDILFNDFCCKEVISILNDLHSFFQKSSKTASKRSKNNDGCF